MSANLTYKPLDNVGINGLNSQTNPASLDSSWLTSAENIVLRESGRISFRKGLKQQVLATSAKIGAITENKGDGETLAAVGGNMYTVDFSTPSTPWTGSFSTGASTSDWEMIGFNNNTYCVQSGAIPVEYNAGTWTVLTSVSGYAAPSGVTTFNPSCGMGYYGRLWVGGVAEEKDVVYYSDTLVPHKFSTGASGSLDLKTVWGNDEIVAIAPFFGQMAIFGKSNIAIYQGVTDPSTMSLVEVIRGIGCASRDTVQAVGDDLLFLSPTGLRSLSRTTELTNVPLVDYSVNIKDSLIRHISQDAGSKAIYVEDEGVYLLTFPNINTTYAFDMKHLTPNKAPRITNWTFDSTRIPTSYAYTETRGLLVGQEVGSISTYEGYYDKTFVDGGTYTDHAYTISFKTIWINLGDSVQTAFLKKMKTIINGGSGITVGVKWYKDFSITPSTTHSFLLNPVASGTTYLYGASTSLYGTSKYAPTYGLKEYNIPLTGRAKHLQIEMSAETNGYVASLQDMTLLFKQGKIR